MNPEQVKEFYEKYFYYIVAGSLVFGAVIGLVPLLFGIKRGNRNLGIIAFIVTIIDSGISPLLGLITCVIFTVIIIVKRAKPQISASETGDQNPAND
jgi:hypothetical protein